MWGYWDFPTHGSHLTVQGFLQNEKPQAQLQFNKAAECFRKCMVKDPSNDSYRKALEMCDKVRVDRALLGGPCMCQMGVFCSAYLPCK